MCTGFAVTKSRIGYARSMVMDEIMYSDQVSKLPSPTAGLPYPYIRDDAVVKMPMQSSST